MKNKYSFSSLYFEVTRSCNLSCPMCMTGCNDAGFVEKKERAELTHEEIVEKVLKPARYDLGISQVGFSGGEFLLREDALELAHEATKLGYKVGINTNGTLVTEDMLDGLKKAAGNNLVMTFGINSILPGRAHSKTRDEALQTTLDAMALCDRLKITKHAIVTVGQFNKEELEETLNWLEKNHIPYNRSPFAKRNAGRDFYRKYGLNRKDMQEFIHPALRKHANGYVSYTPFFLSPELHTQISGGKHYNVTVPQNPSIGCWCGTWIAVNAEGDVAPCAILLDELDAGNVRETPLFRIVDESPIFQDILDRNRLKGRCGRCRYKITCGGCRALAWYETGDYMAEDPSCFFDPSDESEISPHEEETNRNFQRYAKYAVWSGMLIPPED
uniref:Radical SAM additional 4Fe4S-binding SPASM domain-containing protein n=1 Tax=Candidatus Kentrum sp. FW TaxID=2126338 RepID=A0A450TYK2_9GAMM|nr:MAG: radical SAM additional 4Fe4S-binding SPASM domain-containing protein [Candidatus Kentron sp. FW]